MTQPPSNPPTPPVEPPQISVHFELQPGPDGYPWVKCSIQVGTASFAFIATEHQSEQLSPILGNGFAEGAAAARRARLGLVIAGPNDMPTNGHGSPNGVRPG